MNHLSSTPVAHQPQLVAFAKMMPVVDRYGVPVRIGDRIHVRRCIGKYGQCKEEFGVVLEQDPHLGKNNVALYGQFKYQSDEGKVEFAQIEHCFKTERAICYRVHDDIDHYHKKWVKVLTTT